MQLPPGIDGARHAHRDRRRTTERARSSRDSRTVSSDRFAGLRPEPLSADDLLRLRIPQHHEAIAADAVGRGLEEAETRVRGDGRIHRGAAGFQNLDGRERGERLRGGRRAVHAPHGGARGERGAIHPIAEHDVRSIAIADWRPGSGRARQLAVASAGRRR